MKNIKSKEELKNLLYMYPENIQYVFNPNREEQELVVSQNPELIKFIKKPCKRAQEIAVEYSPKLLEFIQNPLDKIILKAIKKDPKVIVFSKKRNKWLDSQAIRFAENQGIDLSESVVSLGSDENAKKAKEGLDFARLCLVLYLFYVDNELSDSVLNDISNWIDGGANYSKKYGQQFARNFRTVISKVQKREKYTNTSFIIQTQKNIFDIFSAINSLKVHIEDNDIEKTTSDFIENCRKAVLIDSESAQNQLAEKTGKILNSKNLVSEFISEEIEDSSDEESKIQQILESVGIPFKIYLNSDTLKKFKEEHPEKHKEYTKLKNNISKKQKDFIRKFVLRNEADYMLASEVREKLKENFSQPYIPKIPKGLKLMITSESQYRDEDGSVIGKSTPLVNLSPNAVIQHNPKYEPGKDTWIFKYMIPGTKETYNFVYTVESRKERKSEVFSYIGNLDVEDIEKLRDRWRRDVISGSEKNKVLGTLVEMMWRTNARIGSKDDTDTNAYGARTWKIKKLKGGKVDCRFLLSTTDKKAVITYRGKGQGKEAATVSHQKHIVRFSGNSVDRALFNNLKDLLKDKSNPEFVFTFKEKNGNKLIPYREVSNYLKSIGFKASPHKLRHLHGSLEMKKLLKEKQKEIKNFKENKPKATEFKKWYEELALEVGRQLGHFSGEKPSAATAISSYIDPTISWDLFNDIGVRYPSSYPKPKNVD